MIQRRNTAGSSLLGLLPALAVAVALVLAAPLGVSTARAVAPPPRQKPLFEDPAQQQEFHAQPINLATAVVGLNLVPQTGRLAAVGGVFAGKHPRVKAWDLTNPLTNRYSRITLGASTLVLNGFHGPGLGAIVAVRNTLMVGDYYGCWALESSDIFRPLPDAWLRHVTDGTGLSTGNVEAMAYEQVLVRAYFTSNKAFASAVRTDLTYTHLFEEPARYRGQVVRVEGRLLRVNRHQPTWRAMEGCVNDVYEAWIFPPGLGSSPYCVLFVEWPAGLPRSVLGKDRLKQQITVSLDGYFFKKYRYEGKGDKNVREAPLVIGHSLTVPKQVETAGEDSDWGPTLIYIFLGSLAGLIFGVLGLTYWYRKSDNDIRKRVLQKRAPEFVLPPPDAMPVAPMVPVPRLDRGPDTPPPRGNLPAAPVERLGERAREPGGGDSADRPPEEGVGS